MELHALSSTALAIAHAILHPHLNYLWLMSLALQNDVGLRCASQTFGVGLVYWGLTPQQQPGSYQGGEMMMMKSVIWWRKPEYPEETTEYSGDVHSDI